jgi:AcrR family transcriptional regulator
MANKSVSQARKSAAGKGGRVFVEDAVREARNKARTRQFIEAATQIMKDVGFQSMSMNTLAQEVGVSVGLAYQYFSSKEAVLLAVILDILDAYRIELPRAMDQHTDPVEKLAAGFARYCRIVDAHRGATILTYRESGTLSPAGRAKTKELEEETTRILAAVIAKGRQQDIFIDADPMLLAYDLILLAHMWALKYWHFGSIMTLDQYRDQQFSIIMEAAIKPAKKQRYHMFLNKIPSGIDSTANKESINV